MLGGLQGHRRWPCRSVPGAPLLEAARVRELLAQTRTSSSPRPHKDDRAHLGREARRRTHRPADRQHLSPTHARDPARWRSGECLRVIQTRCRGIPCEKHGVCVQRPLNTETCIVITNTALRIRCVEFRSLISHFRMLADHEESMGKTRRNPHLLVRLAVQITCGPATERRLTPSLHTPTPSVPT